MFDLQLPPKQHIIAYFNLTRKVIATVNYCRFGASQTHFTEYKKSLSPN
jgi:hypothetical protein